jgi:fibronectin type 3 domain-containing protein
VRCEWSPTTYGDVTHYRVLRSVEGQPGRAFEVGGDATTYVDTTVEHGVAYRYLVRAERADGTAAETSRPVAIVWPPEAPASTTSSTTRA